MLARKQAGTWVVHEQPTRQLLLQNIVKHGAEHLLVGSLRQVRTVPVTMATVVLSLCAAGCGPLHTCA